MAITDCEQSFGWGTLPYWHEILVYDFDLPV